VEGGHLILSFNVHGPPILTSLRAGCKIKLFPESLLQHLRPSFLHKTLQHHKTLFLHNLRCCRTYSELLWIMLILQPVIVVSKSVRPVHMEIG